MQVVWLYRLMPHVLTSQPPLLLISSVLMSMVSRLYFLHLAVNRCHSVDVSRKTLVSELLTHQEWFMVF